MHLTTTIIAMTMITTKMTTGNRGWHKNDIIAKFAKRNNLTQNKVARMKVLCVYPRVDMKCEEVSFYSDGTLPLRVKPQIVIDIG